VLNSQPSSPDYWFSTEYPRINSNSLQ
jgi:hypothetical protein